MELTQVTLNEQTESSLTDEQQLLLERAENELKEYTEVLENTKYEIDLSSNDIDLLYKYISKSAPWKFTEALGIVEVLKELDKAKETGKLETTDIATEAMYYYLSKAEGTGAIKVSDGSSFTSIIDYIRVLKAVTEGVEKIKENNNKLNTLAFNVAARREGIEPDTSI